MSTAVLTAVAWAYRNGARHIGHKSGSGVASGVFARCHRMAGNRVLMVSGTDEPQGLPEVDAPLASGESVVSFQRPSIAGGAQPLGQRTRPTDAAPEPGAPLRLTGSHSVRISFEDRRHPPSCTRRETGAAPADRSPPNPGRHDGGHPDVSAAVEGRLDRGGGHARSPTSATVVSAEAAISTARLSSPLPARAWARASAVTPLPASITTGRPLPRLAATNL